MSRFKSFSKWIGTPVAAMFLLVNLVTNSTTLHDYHTTLSVLLVVAVSALVATAELALYHLLRKVRLHMVFLVVMVALHVVVMVTDAFLIKQFGFIFDNHAMYILAATDRAEIRSFLSTYLSVPVAAGIVLALVAMLWLLWWLARFLARRRWFASAYCALLALGVVASGVIATNFLFRHNGMGLHLRETHAFSRVGHACKAMNDRLNEFVALREVNRHVTATLRQQEHTPSVVLIIGESFSVYHSSLYGYRQPTNPRLGARQADGSLVVFDDAVSQADFTDAAMCSIFTLTEPGDPWWSAPLFPVVFRTAGFATMDQDKLSVLGKAFSCFLMFFGGNPLGTAGGVKTTTLYIIVLAMICYLTGRKVTSFHRRYSNEVIVKAMSLVLLAVSSIFISFIALYAFESKLDIEGIGLSSNKSAVLIYEVFSAFGTVGVTTGVTPYLSLGSKIVICILMFIGRLGPITFFQLLGSKMRLEDKGSYRYVEEDFIIG